MKSRIETVNVNELSVDAEVQRNLREARVNELANDFNPDGLGVITVSRRDNNVLTILDGQHRWAAAKKVGHKLLKAQVYEGLTLGEEAALFRVRNNTKVVHPIDRFRVRLVEKEPIALNMNTYLVDNGWHLATTTQGHSGSFSAIGSLEWVYNGAGRVEHATPNACRLTVEAITAAWGANTNGARADIIRGVGVFMVRYGGVLDMDKLIREMQNYPGGPVALSAEAKVYKTARKMPAADAVATVLTGLYNRKRTVNRIPEWTRG